MIKPQLQTASRQSTNAPSATSARGVNVRAPDAGGWQSRRSVVIAAGVVAMLIALLAVFIVVRFFPAAAKSLPIERVVFVSASEQLLRDVDSDSLQRIADDIQARQTSMFALDIVGLTKIVKELNWVRSATVRRQFPASIVVAIEEHKPVAVWRLHDMRLAQIANTALVNSYGEVFSALISDERRALLPTIGGPDGTSTEVLAKLAAVAPLLQAIERRPVSLFLTPRRAWHTTLDNGSVLELGRGEIESRIVRYVQAYQQIEALQVANARIDLRYSTGIAAANVTVTPVTTR